MLSRLETLVYHPESVGYEFMQLQIVVDTDLYGINYTGLLISPNYRFIFLDILSGTGRFLEMNEFGFE